jgi:cyclopropane fatty-acyl-phospholipid synthase-like methyltransferase
VVKALGTAGIRRILDLGGGSGAYSIAFARTNPEVQCDIVDLPEVVPLTAEYVSQAGVSAQVHIRPGDVLSGEFGSGCDIIMLNAICHMFSAEQNRNIFRRALGSLSAQGRLVVQDFILNPDKTGPLHAALFSLNMLVGTEAGASYSELEYINWMKAAGFRDVCRINLPGPSDLIVGVAK